MSQANTLDGMLNATAAAAAAVVAVPDGQVRDSDVLFGRGNHYARTHPGNRTLHEWTDQYRSIYQSFGCCSAGIVHRKQQYGVGTKQEIVHVILDAIHASGGRFLRKERSQPHWVQVSVAQAREKVSHILRGRARKTSLRPTKSASSRRRQRQGNKNEPFPTTNTTHQSSQEVTESSSSSLTREPSKPLPTTQSSTKLPHEAIRNHVFAAPPAVVPQTPSESTAETLEWNLFWLGQGINVPQNIMSDAKLGKAPHRLQPQPPAVRQTPPSFSYPF